MFAKGAPFDLDLQLALMGPRSMCLSHQRILAWTCGGTCLTAWARLSHALTWREFRGIYTRTAKECKLNQA